MSLSFTVLGTLLFLLPGLFYIVCGVRSNDLIRYQRPRPGSLEILVVAPIISLIAFFVLFTLIWLNHIVVETFDIGLEGAKVNPARVIFDTNYAKKLTEYQLFWVLLSYSVMLVVVAVFSFWESSTRYKGWRYKEESAPWFIKLVKQAEDSQDKSICAEVSVKTETEMTFTYYGVLQYAELDQNDNILNIKLEASLRAIRRSGATEGYDTTLFVEYLDGTASFSKEQIKNVQLYIRDTEKDDSLSPVSKRQTLDDTILDVDIEDDDISDEIYNLDISVDVLNLDGNILDLLKSANIETVEDLAFLSKNDLCAINGIGEIRAERILESFERYLSNE